MRDRLQEVGLAEPGAAVDEERVVGLRRRLGDREGGSVREAVDEPMTNESKVYFALKPPLSGWAGWILAEQPVPAAWGLPPFPSGAR